MSRAPEGLDARGAELWDALVAERDWDAAALVLLAEACRMADRLERLDLVLRGDADTWARIEDDYTGNGRTIELNLDDALGESRQLQVSLLQLLTKLGLGKSEAKTARTASASDDLRARRAARVAAAKGVERPTGTK